MVLVQLFIMADWTVVRYGRRRQRAPQRDRGYGGYDRGTARAPSFSRRRNFSPYPTRPAPPRNVPRYYDPRPRVSYAEAVRYGNRRNYRRWVPPQRREDDVIQQAASPQLGRLVRKLHTIIKLVHHLQNIDPKPGKPEPVMISRMVDMLSTMIKPALPNQQTIDLITGNALNWGYTTQLILKDHYEECLEEQVDELSTLLTPNWESAFEVAVRWARRNLPRLTQDTIDQAEALIVAQAAEQDDLETPQQREPPIHARISRRPATRTSVGTMTDQDPQQGSYPADPPREQRRIRRTRRTVPSEEISTQTVQIDLPQKRIKKDLPPLEEDPSQPEEHIVEESPVRHSQVEEELAELLQQSPHQVDSPEPFEEERKEEFESQDEEDSDGSTEYSTSSELEPDKFRVHRHPNSSRKIRDWKLLVSKKRNILDTRIRN